MTENQNSPNPEEPAKAQLLLNVLKVAFLVAVLVAAWFVLDWLINGK